MDCSKTENYLKERARMGKVDELGNCSINCVECPLAPHHNKEDGCTECWNEVMEATE